MLPHFDLPELIQTVGYLGLFFIVFAENGLFFGFFFPGDSLLFTAGFLASQGIFNFWILVPLLLVAAISGVSVGYWMGGKFGGWLTKQKDSFFFKKERIKEAEEFYEKHGGKAIVLARFIPVVRTFVPIVAGIASMNYKHFITYNLVGGFLWVLLMTFLGFFLGNLIPDIDKYLLPIVALIILVSILPGISHIIKGKKPKGFTLGFRLKIFFNKLIGRSIDK